MTDHNVTDRSHRELTKYRITFAAALAGMPLTEARRKFGYHTLQRAESSKLGA